MSALHQWLEKLGLKYEDLTAEEKKTYESWSQIYTKPEVSIDDLKKFIPVQLEMLEMQAADYQNSEKKDLYLKACIRNLKMIHAFILGPEKQREWLEKHIKQRINN